jgi:hypothetical protein
MVILAEWYFDEICKTTAITVRVYITSLNPHSPVFHCGTKYSYLSTLLRFRQRTPTNRTHFFSWPYHEAGLAFRAFDGMELGSFNFDGF